MGTTQAMDDPKGIDINARERKSTEESKHYY
jgi:hypothetical protein